MGCTQWALWDAGPGKRCETKGRYLLCSWMFLVSTSCVTAVYMLTCSCHTFRGSLRPMRAVPHSAPCCSLPLPQPVCGCEYLHVRLVFLIWLKTSCGTENTLYLLVLSTHLAQCKMHVIYSTFLLAKWIKTIIQWGKWETRRWYLLVLEMMMLSVFYVGGGVVHFQLGARLRELEQK